MSPHPHKTWIEISRQALIHNVGVFRKQLGKKTQLMAVVKANAYGHDAKLVVPFMQKSGASWLGVDSIDEALILREVSDEVPILILGYTPMARLEEAAQHGFRLTTYTTETVRALGAIAKRKKNAVRVHMKCETGTMRQGVLFPDVVSFAKLIGSFPGLILEGLSTHYANIEDTTDHSYATQQLVKFKRACHALENVGIRVPLRHASCTAAALFFPETHFNLARVGLGLYGLWPFASFSTSKEGESKRGWTKDALKPVLTWKTIVAQIKKIPRGTPVSYGLTERVNRASTVAIIPVGYYDGYDRALSSVGTVLIRGQSAKVLGRICMNMMVVDVTSIKDVHLEDEVVLIGTQGSRVVTADDMAKKVGTINYEVVTRINPIIPRILI